MSGVFSSWLTERRNVRSASRALASWTEVSLNDSASVAQLARPLDGHVRRLAVREPAARLGDAAHGPRDRAGEEERRDRRQPDRRERAEQEPAQVGAPGRLDEVGRPEEDERAVADEPGGVERARPVHRDRPVERLPAAQLGRAVGGQVRRRPVQRRLDDPLPLALEERLEAAQAPEREQRGALALGEEVCLRGHVAERVLLDRAAREVGPDRERNRHRERGHRRDPDEQPRPEAHRRTAL